MAIIKIHQYKVVDHPDRAANILEDDTGWLYLGGKLAEFYGDQNIFSSIEEIELVIGQKLEHNWTHELTR